MAKLNHTPGPWRREYGEAGYQVWGPCGEAGSMRIAVCGHAASFDKANADLIAAAPEVLEALKAVCEAYHSGDKSDADDAIDRALELITRIET